MAYLSTKGKYLYDPILIAQDILDYNFTIDSNDIPFSLSGFPQSISGDSMEILKGEIQLAVDTLLTNKNLKTLVSYKDTERNGNTFNIILQFNEGAEYIATIGQN